MVGGGPSTYFLPCRLGCMSAGCARRWLGDGGAFHLLSVTPNWQGVSRILMARCGGSRGEVHLPSAMWCAPSISRARTANAGVNRESSTNPLRPQVSHISTARAVRGGGGPFTYILQGRKGWMSTRSAQQEDGRDAAHLQTMKPASARSTLRKVILRE